MKYKVGDKVRFMKDWTLTYGRVMQAKSVCVVSDTSREHYLLYCVENHLFVKMEHKIVDDNCEKINTAPSVTKRINDKHNILNGLLNSDGSVDGEKLMEKLESQNDSVNHPSHYTDGKIEVIDFIEDKKLGYHLGNACKYISRCRLKNDGRDKVQDLRKAIWYIERQIYLWEKAEG